MGDALFDELKELLTTHGVEVRVEPFKARSERGGGYCRIEGRSLVLLDAGAPEPEQGRALLEVLESIGLSSLGISGSDLSPPLLRALGRRGKMGWPSRFEQPPLARPKGRRR